MIPILGTVAASGGGGPPPPYHADAVHFDGSTYFLADGSFPDATVFSFSVWNVAAISGPFLYGFNEGVVQIRIIQDLGIEVYGQNADGSKWFDAYNTDPLPANWNNIRGKLNTATGTVQVLVDAVELVLILQDSGSPFPFSMGFTSDLITVGGDPADVADLWFAPGVDQTFAIDGSDPFVDADGKPKNPSGFPSSAVLFSGDAATFGQPNLGTGGAFTLTGSLTNASTSPSD